MKYCINCGYQMADDIKFCQNCGTKAESVANSIQEAPRQAVPQSVPQSTNYTHTGNQPVKKQDKNSGLKKSFLLAVCVVGVFFVIGIFVIGIIMSAAMSATTSDNDTVINQNQDVDFSFENKDKGYDRKEEKITMADVRKWYEDRIPAVSQALSEYAKSIEGLTVLNVNSSKFRFGEDSGWYDCHYTFTFTCKVNGVSCTGEARAFMKYKDNTVNWFHFEIFNNYSLTSLVERYDDSYDQIIEDYYKELYDTYN